MGYTNSKLKGTYLTFEEGKEKTILISNWDFTKHPAGYLFRCYVKKEDGKNVDKIWTVWDYESTQTLKKKLKVKSQNMEKEITIVMKRDEDGDATFSFA